MRVLITGASSGIGAEAARELARRGDDLVLVARGRTGLERVAEEVRALGARAVVETADVTDRHAVEAAIDAGAAALGGLDAVIANAGAAAYGLFAEMDPDDAARTVEVTLTGAMNTARAALPHLERTGGVLAVTGSVAGKYPVPLLASYAAAKHGVRGFTRSLGIELAATGSKVRVALVHPGPVDTPFWVNVVPAGPMPPDLPPWLAADPHTIARTLARALDHPRPERVVGLAMKGAALVPRRLRDRAFEQVTRIALGRPGDDPPGRAIWEPSGTGEIRVLAER